ncbi:MAG: hypothetical protein ACLVL7_07970 [Anaerotruncus massiliensis (ex Togo et al. 2019)]
MTGKIGLRTPPHGSGDRGGGDVRPDTGLTLGAVPGCIFTHPEIAFAGLTEEDAQKAGYQRDRPLPVCRNGRRSLKGTRRFCEGGRGRSRGRCWESISSARRQVI